MDKPTVVVTGASGYLGSWIVKTALEAGMEVRGTVRDPENTTRIGHLRELPGQERLTLHKADLLSSGSFDAVADGADVVIHSASPFIRTGVTDAQRQLIEPAVHGTRNVLGSVERSSSVRRVVLTSSVVAIMGDAAESRDYPDRVVDETRWNASSSADYEPYGFSKTEAERAAWELSSAQDRWTLTTINPAFIVGPSLSQRQDSESVSIIRQLGDGSFRQGAPDLSLGFVDVRDVALAHVRAAQAPQADGRFILAERVMSFPEAAVGLRERFGDAYGFPRGRVPNWLLWLLAPRVGLTRRYVRRNMGIRFELDASRSREILGIEYRDAREALAEHMQQVIDRGWVRPENGAR